MLDGCPLGRYTEPLSAISGHGRRCKITSDHVRLLHPTHDRPVCGLCAPKDEREAFADNPLAQINEDTVFTNLRPRPKNNVELRTSKAVGTEHVDWRSVAAALYGLHSTIPSP